MQCAALVMQCRMYFSLKFLLGFRILRLFYSVSHSLWRINYSDLTFIDPRRYFFIAFWEKNQTIIHCFAICYWLAQARLDLQTFRNAPSKSSSHLLAEIHFALKSCSRAWKCNFLIHVMSSAARRNINSHPSKWLSIII